MRTLIPVEERLYGAHIQRRHGTLKARGIEVLNRRLDAPAGGTQAI